MLEYETINISEGIDVNKRGLSKACDICHYWYFKNIGFKFETYLINGCHELMQKAMSFNNVDIVYVKRSAYRVHFWYRSKGDAINIMKGSKLVGKRDALCIILWYIQMSESVDLTYYQRNRDVILNRTKDYYENDKERLRIF